MQKWVRLCLVLMVACSFVSVFLSSLFLGLAIAIWLIDSALARRLKLDLPPYAWAVGLFALTVALAIVFSDNVMLSLRYPKKFLHFVGAALVFTYMDRRLVSLTGKIIMAIALVSASLGAYQYFVLKRVSLLGRATGFMSHWMTFSGQLMIIAVLLTACILATSSDVKNKAKSALSAVLAKGRNVALIAAALAFILFVLVLSMTRSAWLGCLVGIILLMALRSWKLVTIGLGVALLVVLVFPQRFSQRLQSSFDPADYTNRVRMELLHTGLNVVRAHPYMGIGPRVIAKEYPRYRTTDEFPGFAYQHLHNNFAQVAAEMGIFALVAWLAIWVKIGWDQIGLLRQARRTEDRTLYWMAAAALATLLGFLVAGMFEYNFGDSEILTLVLFVLTAPYVWVKGLPADTPIPDNT